MRSHLYGTSRYVFYGLLQQPFFPQIQLETSGVQSLAVNTILQVHIKRFYHFSLATSSPIEEFVLQTITS
jgi:hypothetical protein